MKLLNTLNGSIILEVSEKLKKQLLGKFKLETQDSEEQIVKYINDFERIKQSLPTDKRDITRYDYKTIKFLIDSKEINKNRKSEINSAFPEYVVHWTDYSSGRASPLNREVKLAPNEESAMQLADGLILENIKKGWNLV